jgi:hypothetical protein
MTTRLTRPPPTTNLARSPNSTQKAILDHRKGRATRRELEAAVERCKAEMFTDHPEDGNLLHELIRRGFTKALLQVILPAHPDVSVMLSGVFGRVF